MKMKVKNQIIKNKNIYKNKYKFDNDENILNLLKMYVKKIILNITLIIYLTIIE